MSETLDVAAAFRVAPAPSLDREGIRRKYTELKLAGWRYYKDGAWRLTLGGRTYLISDAIVRLLSWGDLSHSARNPRSVWPSP